jgi:hypothetical protein
MSTTQTHPSNKFYRGEVHDFIEAMETYQAQMEYENAVTHHLSREMSSPITNDKRKSMKTLALAGSKAMVARAIYIRHMQALRAAVVAELRAKDDDEFTAFADALESGDYSTLAI